MLFVHNSVVRSVLLILFFRKITESVAKEIEAKEIGLTTLYYFSKLFEECKTTSMPQFRIDNIQGFINYPSKTTVGFAPKYTSNRKFLANILNTLEFKEMLVEDEEILRKEFVKKLKFCDEMVMDLNLLKQLYDREVDQQSMK